MSERRCVCPIPDPVMQADRRFYCHTCGFQVAAVLCEHCAAKAVPVAPQGETERLIELAAKWRDQARRDEVRAETRGFYTNMSSSLTFRECAEELESILRAGVVPPVQGHEGRTG